MVRMLDAIIGISIGLIVMVAVFSVAPLIGDKVNTAANVVDTVGATGTVTFSGNVSNEEIVTIGTEVYTFNTTTTVIPFEVDISGASNESSLANAALGAEITESSTLVTAIVTTNVTVVESVVKGTAGNSYASTDNSSSIAWGDTTLSGGIANVWGDPAMTAAGADAVSIWTDNASLLSLAVLVMILGIVIAAIMVFGGRKE